MNAGCFCAQESELEEAKRWKVIAAIGAFLLAVAVPMGATLLIAVLVEQSAVPLLILSSVSIMALTMTPIFFGSMVALSPVDPKLPEGRRYFRRLIAIAACIQLLGAVGIVAFAIVVGEHWRLPVVIIAAGLVLAALCSLVGESLRRQDAASPRERKRDVSMTRDERNRKVRRVAITFAVTLVVASAVVMTVLFVLLDEGDDQVEVLAFAFIFGVSIAFLGAAMACLVVSWPLVRSLRDHLGPNPHDHRLIKRVVIRGKNDELNAEQSERAAEYAVVLSDFFPFQIAQFLLLCVALFLQQGVSLISNPDSEVRWLVIGIVLVLLVVIVVYAPITIRQVRRVKRYAADHRELIAASAAGPSNDS